jgi:hypothetical protein
MASGHEFSSAARSTFQQMALANAGLLKYSL